jgi:hypothetical protein
MVRSVRSPEMFKSLRAAEADTCVGTLKHSVEVDSIRRAAMPKDQSGRAAVKGGAAHLEKLILGEVVLFRPPPAARGLIGNRDFGDASAGTGR